MRRVGVQAYFFDSVCCVCANFVVPVYQGGGKKKTEKRSHIFMQISSFSVLVDKPGLFKVGGRSSMQTSYSPFTRGCGEEKDGKSNTYLYANFIIHKNNRLEVRKVDSSHVLAYSRP